MTSTTTSNLHVGSLYRFYNPIDSDYPFSCVSFDGQAFRPGGNPRGVEVKHRELVLLVGFAPALGADGYSIPVFLAGERLACCSGAWFEQNFVPVRSGS